MTGELFAIDLSKQKTPNSGLADLTVTDVQCSLAEAFGSETNKLTVLDH